MKHRAVYVEGIATENIVWNELEDTPFSSSVIAVRMQLIIIILVQ